MRVGGIQVFHQKIERVSELTSNLEMYEHEDEESPTVFLWDFLLSPPFGGKVADLVDLDFGARESAPGSDMEIWGQKITQAQKPVLHAIIKKQSKQKCI